MSMAGYGRPAAFRIGRVFGDTFGVLGRNFGLCIGLAAIFSGIPAFVYGIWAGPQPDLYADTAVPLSPTFDGSSFLVEFIFIVVYMVFGSILQAGLVRATIEDLNGRRPTLGDALSRATALLLPVIGLSFLVYLGVGIGFVLLIIPGLYLLVRWSAAVPVLVHERLGVLASMKRSSELTKGSRWRIFGLFVVLVLAIWVVQMVLGLLAAAITPVVGEVIAIGLIALLAAVPSVIGWIAAAVAYVELRYVKEGTDVKELAEIFA